MQKRQKDRERLKRRKRTWVWFADFAEELSWTGDVEPNVDRMKNIYRALAKSISAGEFDVNGRSLVLCKHEIPDVIHNRIGARELEMLPSLEDGAEFMRHCWAPMWLVRKWLDRRGIAYPVGVFFEHNEPLTSRPVAPGATSPEALTPSPVREPTVSDGSLMRWYRDRVANWPTGERPPTSDDDLLAAKARFPGHTVQRSRVRALRQGLAPASWTSPGRRKSAPKS